MVIVDEVNDFAVVGYCNLAPPMMSRMFAETDRLTRSFSENGWPILAFLDKNEPVKPELPNPPHCELGAGEEELVVE